MKDVTVSIADNGNLVASVDRFGVNWLENFNFMDNYDTSIKSFKRSFIGDSYYYMVDIDYKKVDSPEMLDSFLFDVGLNK